MGPGSTHPSIGWARQKSSRASLVLLAAVSAFTMSSWAGQAGAQVSPAEAGLANPPANIPRTPQIEQGCAHGPGLDCQQAVVESIDRARSAEGIGPLDLPAYYSQLSVSEQLLVLANLERVDRGLPGFSGLSAQLDNLASRGATANGDPDGPQGASWGSNWAGGEASALLADYDWMYNDGLGSPNMDCATPRSSGCWDHRANVLGNYGASPSMGAASTKVHGVNSMTELFSSGSAGRLDWALPRRTATVMAPTAIGAYTGHGYWEVTGSGEVFAYAGGRSHGSTASAHLVLARPVVGLAATPDGGGYWEVASDGGVFSYGNAHFYGSAARDRTSGKVVGMAAASGGKGYWLVTDNGSVYSFGDARFDGTPGGHVGKRVVGITSTPNGRGYWIVTSTGTIYSFGDARYYGPHAPLHLNQSVVGMAATHDGRGYWIATSGGEVYSFGDAGRPARLARRHPSFGAERAVGIAAGPSGYYVGFKAGQVLAFGGAPSVRRASSPRHACVVAVAAVSVPVGSSGDHR